MPRHFVILEDDVVLLDATRFLAELKWAIDHDVGFYSFQLLLPEYLAAAKDQVGPTPTPFNASLRDANLDMTLSSLRQRSCVYQFSTTAQVFGRRLAQQIIDADTDSFCRLPIDMYIARAGPWYSTVHAVTRHVGKRLSLVPSLP
jgi:GR25 family glycosyltransferase involved in LPS biosynthesis